MTSSSSTRALFSHIPSVCEVVSGGPDLSRMLQGDQTTTERTYQLPHCSHHASKNTAQDHRLSWTPHPTVDSECIHSWLKAQVIAPLTKSFLLPCCVCALGILDLTFTPLALASLYFRLGLHPVKISLISKSVTQHIGHSSYLSHLWVDEQTLSISIQVLDKKSLGWLGHLPHIPQHVFSPEQSPLWCRMTVRVMMPLNAFFHLQMLHHRGYEYQTGEERRVCNSVEGGRRGKGPFLDSRPKDTAVQRQRIWNPKTSSCPHFWEITWLQ